MPIEIRRKDVKTLVAQGRAQLVEVLPPAEYKREHLPQAVNIPLETMTSETTRSLRKDVAVIVYCEDFQCDLSARAAWRLESMGFQEVYRYTPGKADWLAADDPVFHLRLIRALRPVRPGGDVRAPSC